MHAAYLDIRRRNPELEIDGEMQGDTALSEEIRKNLMPNSSLKENANLFIMPNVDAANIAFNLIKCLSDGISIGPILLGAARPAHILTPSATARNIVNMTAIACVGAQMAEDDAEATRPRALAI
jgi:malate dehydrogenase (oxaloacetate-decarboxylating)(NADP+)